LNAKQFPGLIDHHQTSIGMRRTWTIHQKKLPAGGVMVPQYSGEENVSSRLSGDFNTYVVRDSAQTSFTLRKLRQFNFFQEVTLNSWFISARSQSSAVSFSVA
jgi:hypothetical protein